MRKEFGLDPETPLVGMAARITSMKGQDFFLRMAALVKRRVTNVRFLLAGATFCKDDEEYSQGLRRLVAELGLQKEVIFAGYRDDMPDVLAAMDCFAHPSRHGAFVSVLIEAMASGLPIVASDVDGIPECIGREGSAVLLPPDDPAEWADAVVKILREKEFASCMAENGRERAARLFEITPLACLTAEALEAVYQRYPRRRELAASSGRSGSDTHTVTMGFFCKIALLANLEDYSSPFFDAKRLQFQGVYWRSQGIAARPGIKREFGLRWAREPIGGTRCDSR